MIVSGEAMSTPGRLRPSAGISSLDEQICYTSPAFACSPTPAVKTANPPLLAPKSANSDSSIRGNSLEEHLRWESRLQYIGRGNAPAFRTVRAGGPRKHSDGS